MTVGELLNTIDQTMPVKVHQRIITGECAHVAIITRGMEKFNDNELLMFIKNFRVCLITFDGHYINIFFQESSAPRMHLPNRKETAPMKNVNEDESEDEYEYEYEDECKYDYEDEEFIF